MTHVTCRLTAKNRDQLRNPTLSNRVWATFTFFRQSLSSLPTDVVSCLGGRVLGHRTTKDGCFMWHGDPISARNLGTVPADRCYSQPLIHSCVYYKKHTTKVLAYARLQVPVFCCQKRLAHALLQMA